MASDLLIEADASKDADRKKPFLILFFSVDLDNSTSIKREFPQKWLVVFQAFFTRSQLLMAIAWRKSASQFADEYNDGSANEPWRLDNHPRIWKTLGDEIVFQMRVAHENDVLVALHAFQFFLKTLGARVEEAAAMNFQGSKFDRLGIKGTAWIAGFPDFNLSIDIGDSQLSEYIGPSMDAGFRIKEYADVGRMAISLELATLMGRRLLAIRNVSLFHINYYGG